MLDEIEKKVKPGKLTANEKKALKLDLGRIPEVMLDNTDRNRTSPFAFTGNKFEFRAVGSSANCSQAMITLNTIMAHQLTQFKKDVDKRINKSTTTEDAIWQVLRDYIVASRNIRFEGNNYSKEWVKEAAKRGLSNIQNTPAALDVLIKPKTIQLYETHHIYSKREQEARHEIQVELYTKKIQIESRILGDMAITQILPAAIKYQNELINNVRGLKEIFNIKHGALASVGIKDQGLSNAINENGNSDSVFGAQLAMVKEISERVSVIRDNVKQMIDERKRANKIEDMTEKAYAYCKKVKPYFDEIRYQADKLEILIDDSIWPFPKYRELLFVK